VEILKFTELSKEQWSQGESIVHVFTYASYKQSWQIRW